MTFSVAKKTVLRPQKEKKLFTFFVALICAAFIFMPYIIYGSGYFTLYGDFNVQQIPFYKMCHDAVRSGNFGWNWYTDLGANFIGSYSFYLLGSPFFWLTIPFPSAVVPYLMGPLLMLKFACAAFTAYLYIRRFTRTPNAASIGALLYAFSGFSVYNIFFNHFHEAIIVFPLLLLSMELLITENRRGVFALCVALSAVVNYYFFFGMVVFCIIYFFVRLFSGCIKVKFSRFVALFFEAVIGVGISAILLLPSILAISGNSRLTDILCGWSGIMYGKEQIYFNIFECFFFPPDIPARPVFCPGAEVRWSSLGGWLPVFGMAGVFAVLLSKKGSWLKRMICISALFAAVPILNSTFSALNESYYARWFYMPILLMCLMSAYAFEDDSVDFASGFKWSAAITIAITLVICLFPQKDNDGKLQFGIYSRENMPENIIRLAIACGIAVICLVLVRLVIILKENHSRKLFATAMSFICIISVIYGNVFVFSGRLHSYDIKEVVIDSLIEGDVDLPSGEYRIDAYDCCDNTGMSLGYPSINAFHSIVPSSIMEFYTEIGIERSVGSRPGTEYTALRPLLSVKYLLNRVSGDKFVDDDGETLMPDYKYLKTEDGYYIYENENYVPYGFSYDYYISEKDLDEYGGESKTRMMLKAVCLNDKQIKKYSGILKDVSSIDGEDVYDDAENKVTLSLTDEAMKSDCKLLTNTSAYYFKSDKRGFTAKVSREKDSLVFFSVPYDKGWKATVNGKTAEIEKVNVGFMAVKVGNGESEIRFTYETPGLKLGAVVTVLFVLILLFYLLIAAVYLKKHRKEENYPEGKKMLTGWQFDDAEEAARIREYEQLSNDRRSYFDDE